MNFHLQGGGMRRSVYVPYPFVVVSRYTSLPPPPWAAKHILVILLLF